MTIACAAFNWKQHVTTLVAGLVPSGDSLAKARESLFQAAVLEARLIPSATISGAKQGKTEQRDNIQKNMSDNSERRTQVVEKQWQEILEAAKQVALHSHNLIQASDDLAEHLNYREDYVLRRVFNPDSRDRRNCKRILNWIADSKDEIFRDLYANYDARKEKERRAELLSKLNLTEDEKVLLGIA